MSDLTPILIPLINPNEPECLIVALNVSEGQRVAAGDVICVLETTKSTTEITADAEGYIVGLRLSPGQIVSMGDILGYLSQSPDTKPVIAQLVADQGETTSPVLPLIPEGLRITQPALLLASQHGVDLSRLPSGPLITESVLQEWIGTLRMEIVQPVSGDFDPFALIMYGGGGHGKMIIDLVKLSNDYHMIGIVDDSIPVGTSILGIPVLGNGEILPDLRKQGVQLAINAVGGISNVKSRIKVFERLAQAGFGFPVVIHPRATVEASASLNAGAQILAQAYIGSDAQIGFGDIIGTGAIISHDCRLGNFTNISPGALLAGEVELGERVLVGMGATINLKLKWVKTLGSVMEPRSSRTSHQEGLSGQVRFGLNNLSNRFFKL